MEIDVCGGGGDGGLIGSEEEQKQMSQAAADQKVKRRMKTAAQIQLLQTTYAVEPYPAEALRAELSIKLGLSDRQLQMWFCHRRLKDRKARSISDTSPPALAGVGSDLMLGSGSTGGFGNELSLGQNPYCHLDMLQTQNYKHQKGAAVPRIGVGVEMLPIKRHSEVLPAVSELRAIALVEAQLREPLRTDGPILGMEFDPLPPTAFGKPKPTGRPCESENVKASPYEGVERAMREYQFLPEKPSVRSDIYDKTQPSQYSGSSLDIQGVKTPLLSGLPLMPSHYEVSTGYTPSIHMPGLSLLSQPGKLREHLSLVDINIAPTTASAIEIAGDALYGSHLNTTLEIPFMATEKKIVDYKERMDRKRKCDEARIAREVEAHEKRIRKELEKQDILRRKREEQIQRELERLERERRKEEDRLLREKQREEERIQRERRREMERKERFLQKEYIRAEKMRIREESRKERETARIKAANDRATARKMAKDSIELIEDEHLELMELAASNRGLHSISELDSDTLGILKYFEDMLPDFPLKSVQLKTPFNIQPWADSEENVGNLLMVWRFLINFADVLGLWPFTLDEFLQAFHDHDSRLMGEVHIALLRTIVKDIEDAARTPASAVGANQSSVVHPSGGHPLIVEGAYGWGFDIKSWQRHMNALTWPEILRQLALSAGFGPKLKKKSVGQVFLPDVNEGNDGVDAISNLRNGIAAENALAIMQERGLSNPRRSRHRLTPGTVKYAAYYVLSLEGGKGLTIQDVADKIQKSGLRDLRTSKTPEASISAALSRDTKLFERTAPSTYCVRTPYRKDATDAAAILTAAREKIQLFIGNLEEEEAEDVEKENTEKDEDSESEGAEDHEVVNFHSQPNFDVETTPQVNDSFGHDNTNTQAELPEMTDLKITGSSSISGHKECQRETEGTQTSLDHYIDIVEATDEEKAIVDENDTCEPWVQGLTEGEYYDLSVQERLDALVALIGMVNEGNSIRSILEERLEAAYALKKQMWAEAQVDKRRLKEDYTTKVQASLFTPNKGDQSSTSESRQNPFVDVDVPIGLASTNTGIQGIDTNASFAEKTMQELATGALEKPKSQRKSYIAHKAEETHVYRSLPLGQDRRRNRYWQFITSQSFDDPGSGRIFVELHDGRWRVIDSIKDFDSLLASIDIRGTRESHLHFMLQKIEASFKKAVMRWCQRNDENKDGDSNVKEISPVVSHHNTSAKTEYHKNEDNGPDPTISTSFIIELGRNRREEFKLLKRYQEFEKWIWKECYNSSVLCAMKYEKRRCKPLLTICGHCHGCFDDNLCPLSLSNQKSVATNLKCPEHVAECKMKLGKEPEWMLHIMESSPPSRIRLLKALLASLEASVPPEALDLIWSKDCQDFWIKKLKDASSAADLFQTLTLLEGAIKRSFLSADYETTDELLRPRDKSRSSFNYSSLRVVPVLPWIPQTTSAVALRLMEFDKSICYTLQQKDDLHKNPILDNLVATPPKYTLTQNVTEDMLVEPRGQNLIAEGTAIKSSSRCPSRGRGRPRSHEGKFKGVAIDTKRETRHSRITLKNENLGPLPVWKGKSRGRGKRGRKSAKKRQKKAKKVPESTASNAGSRKIVMNTTLPFKQQDSKDLASVQVRNGDDLSSPEQSPSNYYIASTELDKYDNQDDNPELAEGSGCPNQSISVKHAYDAVDVLEEEECEQDDDGNQGLHSEDDGNQGLQSEDDEHGKAYHGNQHLHTEEYDNDYSHDEDVPECYQGEPYEGEKVSSDEDQIENSDVESMYSSSDYSD